MAGRAGKQPDGSAKTREVKLVLVWTAERRDCKTGSPERDAGSVSGSAGDRERRQQGHRSGTVSVCSARTPGSGATRLFRGPTPRRAGGRCRLDLARGG